MLGKCTCKREVSGRSLSVSRTLAACAHKRGSDQTTEKLRVGRCVKGYAGRSLGESKTLDSAGGGRATREVSGPKTSDGCETGCSDTTRQDEKRRTLSICWLSLRVSHRDPTQEYQDARFSLRKPPPPRRPARWRVEPEKSLPCPSRATKASCRPRRPSCGTRAGRAPPTATPGTG